MVMGRVSHTSMYTDGDWGGISYTSMYIGVDVVGSHISMYTDADAGGGDTYIHVH